MRILLCSGLLLVSSLATAQTTPTSQPASQPTSQPALPPPETVDATEPLEGYIPYEQRPKDPASEPVYDSLSLPMPEPPGTAEQLGHELFGGTGLAIVGAASGALIGVLSATQTDNPGAAREEVALGWSIGSGLGAGMGVQLAARAHERGGSRVGSLVGGLLGSALAVGIGFPASGIADVGIDNARRPGLFFFGLPFVASIGGAMLGYELFPTGKKKGSSQASK